MAHQGDTSEEEALHDLEYDELHHVQAPIPRSESSKRARGRSEIKRNKSGTSMPKVLSQHKLLRGCHLGHHHGSTSPHSHHKKSAKGAKQKAIQKARAFKDLDMTIELLGIDSTKHALSLLAATSMGTIIADKLSQAGASLSGAMTSASPGWATPPASAAYTPTAAGRSSAGMGPALTTAGSSSSGGAGLSRSSSAGGGINFQRSGSLSAALPPGRMALAAAGDDQPVPVQQLPEPQLSPVLESPLKRPQQRRPLGCRLQQQADVQQQHQQQSEGQKQSWVAAVKSAVCRKHRHNRSRSANVAEIERKRSLQQQQQQQTSQQVQFMQPPSPSYQQQQQQHVQFMQQPPPPPWQSPAPSTRSRPSSSGGAAGGLNSSRGANQQTSSMQQVQQQHHAAVAAVGSPFLAQAQQQPSRVSDSSSSADISEWQPQQQQRGFQQGPSLLRRGSSGNSSGQGLPPQPPPPAGQPRHPHPANLAASHSSSTLQSSFRGTGAAVQLSASHPAQQDFSQRSSVHPASAARSKSARAMLQSQQHAAPSSPGHSSNGAVVAGRQGSSSSVGSASITESAPGERQSQQQTGHHLSLSRRQQSSPFPRRRLGAESHSNPASAGNTGGSGLPAQHMPDKALEKLQHDRAQWRSALHHVLEGQASLSPDDIEASLAESTARAEDLQAELNGLITATREASSWKAREQCLGWMEEGYKRAKSITKELRSHLSLVESQGRSATYSNIINTMTPAVAALAVALTDNLAAALMPWTALQQQGQQPCNADRQQHPADDAAGLQALQEGSVGPGGAVQRGYAAAAAAACDGSHSGAAAVLPGGDEECRLAFRIIRRWLELAKEMKDRCRTNAHQIPAVQACCNKAIDDVLAAVVRLMGATVSATAYLQASLLTHLHLSANSFAHKVNNDSRLLILMWRYCHEMCAKVWRNFDALRHTALFMLLELLSAAAKSSTEMQRIAAAEAVAKAAATAADTPTRQPLYRSGSSSSSEVGSIPRASSNSSLGSRSAAARSALGDISDESASDDEVTAIPTGSSVWGSAATSQGLVRRSLGSQTQPRGPGLRFAVAASDEDVQAQAWLPQVLLGLLHWSSVTARQVCEELESAEQYSDAGLPSLASEVEEELAAALEDLQEAFFYLALTNTRRVARLASSPEGLACWALEILKDAAEGALKFVQDYDTSALGLGQVLEASGSHDQGERLFKSLKRSTDAVINGLLRVKRLLKIRRTDTDSAATTPAAGQLPQRQQPKQQQQGIAQLLLQQSAPAVQQQGIAQLLLQQSDKGQQQRLERKLSFGLDTAGTAAGSEQPQQLADGSGSSAAAVDAAAGTGPGRPPCSGIRIANSDSTTAAAAAGRQGDSLPSLAATSPLVSHMPLGYSPPGAWTAAAHTHAVASGMGYSPPAAGAAVVKVPPLMISPSGSPGRDQSPPLAILGTTPSAQLMSRRASRTLPLLMDIVSNGNDSSTAADGVAAAAAAGASAAEKWAGFKSMSGSGKFPARPAAAATSQHATAASSTTGLLQSPPGGSRSGTAAAAAAVSQIAVADKPQAVFSPFGAAAVSAVPFSPAPDTVKSQQPPAWSLLSQEASFMEPREARLLQERGAQGQQHTGQSQQQQDLQQQEQTRPRKPLSQQQQQDVDVQEQVDGSGPEPSGGSFVHRSRSFKDALTAASGPVTKAAAGSTNASSERQGAAAVITGASPFAPAAQAQQEGQQQQQQGPGQTDSMQPEPSAGQAAAARHPPNEILSPELVEPPVAGPAAASVQQQQQGQQQRQWQSLDVLPKGSAGVNPNDVALAAKLFSTGSMVSSSRDQASTVTSSGVSSTIASCSGQMGVEVFSSAGAAGSSDVDDIAAAADALADASGSGGAVTAAQVVLPAALAILRMIQVSDDEFWKIRWHDLEPGLLRKLGNGSYGQVFQGVYHNAQVAIKVLNIDYDDPAGLSAETLLRFKAEVDFQRKLSYHPNVVRFIGACCELPVGLADALAEAATAAPAAAAGDREHQQQRGLAGQRYIVPAGLARGVKLAIVMELCHLGSLFSMIGQARRVRAGLADEQPAADLRRAYPYGFQFHSDWLTRLEVVRGAAAGLEYMHQHGVIHRDLTSYNLLLDFGKPWQVKVCDFNLSRMVAQQQQLTNSGNPNSPGWQSPEMLSGQPYGKAADVFSFGVVLWEAITLKEPWREETEGRTALYYIMNAVTAGDRLSLPEPQDLVNQGLGFDQAVDLLNLTASCWCQLPVERPTMAEVACKLGEIAKAVREERRAVAAAGAALRGAANGR